MLLFRAFAFLSTILCITVVSLVLFMGFLYVAPNLPCGYRQESRLNMAEFNTAIHYGRTRRQVSESERRRNFLVKEMAEIERDVIGFVCRWD